MRFMGWVREIRDLGKIAFLICYNDKEEIQLTIKRGVNDHLLAIVEELTRESFIIAEGKEVPAQAKIGKEMIPEKIEVISKAEPLPIEIYNPNTSLAKRLDWRFLDLKNPQVRRIFEFQAKLVREFENFFYDNGFTRIFPSVIVGEATEGGANVFELKYFDKKAYLAQSPQFYKEMALLSFSRVFSLTPVFRAEPHFTTRHLCEYQSLDVEMITQSQDELLATLDACFKHVCKRLGLKYNGLPRVTFKEANEILKSKNIETEPDDITPEGERVLGEYAMQEYDSPFIAIVDWPFEARPFYHMRHSNGKLTYSFDVLYDGLEIVTGSLREHRYEQRRKNAMEKGINPDSFDHMRFFKYGMPPHGGFAIGVERFTKQALGLANIREACLLPRDPERLRP